MDQRQAFERAIAHINEAIARSNEKHKAEIDALVKERAVFEEILRNPVGSGDGPSREQPAPQKDRSSHDPGQSEMPQRRELAEAVLRYLQAQLLPADRASAPVRLRVEGSGPWSS